MQISSLNGRLWLPPLLESVINHSSNATRFSALRLPVSWSAAFVSPVRLLRHCWGQHHQLAQLAPIVFQLASSSAVSMTPLIWPTASIYRRPSVCCAINMFTGSSSNNNNAFKQQPQSSSADPATNRRRRLDIARPSSRCSASFIELAAPLANHQRRRRPALRPTTSESSRRPAANNNAQMPKPAPSNPSACPSVCVCVCESRALINQAGESCELITSRDWRVLPAPSRPD